MKNAIDMTNKYANIIGIIILLIFGGVLFFMFSLIETTDDTVWTRATYLLSGIEAIVFTVVGYFFGKEVNRERAEVAEKKIDLLQNQIFTLNK